GGCNTFAQIGTSATTSYSDTGLVSGTSYSYQVRATDGSGNRSQYSNVASATTSAAPSGLVLALAFDEPSGTTVNDSSGTGNNGNINGATRTAGKYGGALSFNGASNLVTVPQSTSLNLTTGMTLEAWVHPSASSSSWQDLIYKADDVYYLEAVSS